MEEWTLEDISYGNYDESCIPDLPTTQRLLQEMHTRFVTPVRHDTIFEWLKTHFEVDFTNLDWEFINVCIDNERYRISGLRRFLVEHNAFENESKRKIADVARVVLNVHECVMHVGRLFRNTDPQSIEARNFVPESIRDDEAYVMQTATLQDDLEDKNTNFQNVFLHLTRVLECKAFRRANGRFFKRVITPAGLETMAFSEVMTITEFVGYQTSHVVNFRAWKWVTEPTANFEKIVDALKNRPLPEAPDLQENASLRSFGGDKEGRGSGIYDSKQDMFWPYALKASWAMMASEVTRVRRRLDASYECTPPKSSDVCIIHLETVFPYDIFSEIKEVGSVPVGVLWRNAYPFECVNCYELDAPELAEELERVLPPIGEDAVEERIGDAWLRVSEEMADCLPEGKISPDLLDALSSDESAVVYLDEPLYTGTKDCVVFDNNSDPLIPLVTPAGTARARVSSHLAGGQRIRKRTMVRAPSGRCFRLHTGRTWRDCDASEIEHIYNCQEFTDHDIFFLFALKGRLFFDVGELDSHEMTLMIEGIGGSGKSTDIKAHQPFWPPHLKGHLSSNMQPEFGMSQFTHCKVIFCNEVSSDLNVVQEEWQTSVSGEWGSYNRKFRDPIECKWMGQHFWVGNSFPTRFKNLQGQVSRRLAGVLFAKAISPRDGNILKKIRAKLGSLLRKDILAYHEFVGVTGSVDPMSQPEKLPPAFFEYYRKGRRNTDPVEDFLSDGTYVAVAEGKVMLMNEFKELYTQYRTDNHMGKALKWSEAAYRTPFSERGIFVTIETSFQIGGEQYSNVQVVHGVEAKVRC